MAEAIYRQILATKPDHAGALHLLGLILFSQGKPQDAYPLVSRGAQLAPKNPAYLANLGAVCRALGNLDEAAHALQRSLQLVPNNPAAWNNLGNIQTDREELDLALSSFRRALELDPQHPTAQINIAKTLAESGDFAGAFAEYRSRLANAPNATLHSDFLLDLHYPEFVTAEEIFQEHLRFDQLYARPLAPTVPSHYSDRSPDRPLQIGYVSPDLRQHPVAQLLEPLLANHDRSQFKIHCYSDSPADQTQHRLRGYVDHWTDTRPLSDDALCHRMAHDKIDILIDLTGHTRGNRLLVFARKPAPVQVTCIGYPNTTGLTAIDYRLTDPLRDPPDSGNGPYTEKSYRLPETAWCYRPFDASPPWAPPPFEKNRFITFGVMNILHKITPTILRLWAEILRELPASRLAIAVGGVNRSATFGQSRLAREFTALGINPSRLLFIPRSSHEQDLHHLTQFDIALDTFPYHGGMTTLDTLWMGTPVIVLSGQSYVSRVGVSILHNLGLNDLIARTPQQYVQIALTLARDRPRLAQLHQTLRRILEQSQLMNAGRYTANYEKALRQMWREYCSRQ
jgi:predicted O-linked N-acetylglucosamine transferase (SPINDLY family)